MSHISKTNMSHFSNESQYIRLGIKEYSRNVDDLGMIEECPHCQGHFTPSWTDEVAHKINGTWNGSCPHCGSNISLSVIMSDD